MIKGGALFLLLVLFLLQPVLAYDQHSTHPSLTYEIAQFFNGRNSQSSRTLSANEIQWLKQGAMEEDEPARWINHFYDPVHGVGWSGKHLGRLSPEEGYKLGGDIAPRHSLASIDWVTNQDYQAAYGRQYGNQTWQKAIKSYIDGDKKSAFIALGHVLHLVEDATVPDHVRDDSHPGIEGDPGSPYETFSKAQTDASELNTAETLLKNKTNFKKISSVSQAIKDVATYVNQNFFSEDTISNEEFQNPEIVSLEIRKVGFNNGTIKTFLFKGGIFLAVLNNTGHSTNYSTKEDIFVLPSYRDHLFPEAVLTRASVINLFYDEVEKYRQHPELLEPIVPDSNDSFLTALEQFPKRTVLKACGISESTCKAMYNSLDSIADSLKNTSQAIALGLSNNLNNILDSAKTKLGLNNNQAVSQNSPQLANSNVNAAPVAAVEGQFLSKPGIVLGEKIYATAQAPQQVNSPQISTPVAPTAPEIIKNPVPATPSPAQKNIYVGNGPSGSISMPIVQTAPIIQAVPNSLAPTTSVPIVPSSTIEQVASSTVTVSTTIFSSSTIEMPTTTVVATTTVTTNQTSTTSTTTTVPVVVDMAPPSVPVLSFVNQSGPSSTNILINLSSSDVSLPIYFNLQVSMSSTSDWQTIVTRTSSTTINFFGTHGQAYYFRARATDAVGNVSNWSQTSSPVFVNWSGEVVINEVAWAGTSASYPNDEWFELYNNTDQPIDFTGWKVFVSGKQISISKINNKIIPAKGYFLLERTSDDAVKEIGADIIFSVTGGLNNAGAKLELFKPSGEKADEANASAGWFAGDAVLYKSMERINPLGNGSDPLNWQSNQGFRETGRTFNGGLIYGSPKRSNFGFITLSGNQDDGVRTLTKENNPYILQSYAVPTGKTLIIEPGVIIKSYYSAAKIDIFGSLQALGSTQEKIIFTSGRDVNVGSNLENAVIGSWVSPTSSPQDWQGLWFRPSSTGIIDQAIFRFAGKSFVVPPNALPVSQAIRAENTSLIISNSDFSDNGPLTFFEKNATTSIVNTSFKNGDQAIQSENSNLSVVDSSVENFTNTNGPLLIKDRWPSLAGIQYRNNTLNMPFLESVIITEPEVSIGESENLLLNVLTVFASSTLHINPGASIYLPLYGIMEVRGSIQADGVMEKPINFLPYPASVNWGNIRLYNSHSTFNYVNFVQGNRLNGRPENLNGMILANDSTIEINNSILLDSEANFIQANNSTVQIFRTSIGATVKTNNTKGIKSGPGRVSLDAVNFSNLYMGMESASADLPQLIIDLQNMSSSSFSNVDYFWQPLNLWSFPVPNTQNLIEPL